MCCILTIQFWFAQMMTSWMQSLMMQKAGLELTLEGKIDGFCGVNINSKTMEPPF